VLQHIVLSHHGEVSDGFGSARSPSTPEAIAVHYIENLDAKMMMSLGATRGQPAPGTEGNWTEYMKAFSGRLYRPDVAPADAPVVEPTVEVPAPTASNGRHEPVVDVANVAISNPLFASVEPRRK
jgi:3'-5' exoribonuclease